MKIRVLTKFTDASSVVDTEVVGAVISIEYPQIPVTSVMKMFCSADSIIFDTCDQETTFNRHIRICVLLLGRQKAQVDETDAPR